VAREDLRFQRRLTALQWVVEGERERETIPTEITKPAAELRAAE
jgi:hypothetical protein